MWGKKERLLRILHQQTYLHLLKMKFKNFYNRLHTKFTFQGYTTTMKYFTFIDKDSFSFSSPEIWEMVLNVGQWPRLWKQVIDVEIQTNGEIHENSKIDCYFTLFHLMHLHFHIQLTSLKKPQYASFTIGGDFSGTGRWILRENENQTDSTLNLHLQTHHGFLKLISYLPFGESFIQYSHRRVMLEGKNMIIKKLQNA